MNIQKYDIVNELVNNNEKNQRELARATGYSVGKVNSSIKELKEEGYLTSDMKLTEKANAELKKRKPRNAVILAAGYGMRMVPIRTL